MSSLYLDPGLEPSAARVGETLSVSGDEARHAVTVNRTRVGDHLAIGNGAGLIVAGTVIVAEPGMLQLRVDEVRETPRAGPAIHLVQALAKGDRDELAVQAATELGVDAVIPWAAERSISRWNDERAAKGHARWTAVVREATKQSMRAWLPDVGSLMTTPQLAQLGARAHLVVLEPSAREAVTALKLDDRDIVLVVGPEGGIAPRELDALGSAGASTVRLGETVLRTSTAGPAAIAVLSAKLRRW